MLVVDRPQSIQPRIFIRGDAERLGAPVQRRIPGFFSRVHKESSDVPKTESLAGRCQHRIVARAVQR